MEKNTFSSDRIRKENSHESEIPQPGRGTAAAGGGRGSIGHLLCNAVSVHYLGDWRLTPPWLVLPAGMLAVTLYCLIRELAAVTIADGNICLHRLGFKVTEFPLEELRSAKLIFKNGQCSRVYLSVHEETDLRRALRTANRRGGKSIQFAATTKRLEQLTKLVLLQPCDYPGKRRAE